MARRVHIRDVARHAGVSIGTVSNVLNSVPSVAPDYVLRVQDAIDTLGFVRNDIARQLKSGGGKTISLLVLSNYNSFFNALAEAAEESAEAHGYSVVLASSAQSASKERKYLELFEEQRSRGVLLAPIGGISRKVEEVHRRGTPIILLGESAPSDRFCSVYVDTELGGYLAIDHLLREGRRRIAIVGGPYAQVKDRVDGAHRSLRETPAAEHRYFETADLTIGEGRRIGELLGGMDPLSRPDGVFAVNDLVAIGLLDSLVRTEHLSVPGDISIVGHDDIEFAASTIVPLTTIRQPVIQIAAAAVELVVKESIEGVNHDHVQSKFAPELVLRGSTLGRL